MKRLASVLKIRPGEGRRVAALMGLMSCMAAGTGMGAASIDALFFARFGVEFLPYLYIALGVVTFLSLMSVTALLGRVRREHLYMGLPIVLGCVVLLSRLLVGLNLRWFYPLLFVGKESIFIVQTVILWGLASVLFDSRQSRRLFPLFMAGGIAGSALGSLLTPLLVSLLGTENVLLAWGLLMVLALALVRNLVADVKAASGQRKPAGNTSMIKEIQSGYQYVRRTPLLRWYSAAHVLFSLLWFSLLLPFSRAAAGQFPVADNLASFLGLFQGLQSGAALLVSLFLANRLFDRFGLLNMLLSYPAVYLTGFSVLLAFNLFPVIVAFRFIQLIWGFAIAETAYQASLGAIPAQRRDQSRAFMQAVPGQAGIIISGILLVLGDQALQPAQMYWIGIGAALVCFFVMWRARHAHKLALVEALRLGNAQVFFSEEQPFGGFNWDGAALPVLLAGLDDPHAGVRRLSAEILEQAPAPQAVGALVKTLGDPDGEVRLAALSALAATDTSLARVHALACLKDPEAELRKRAVEVFSQTASDSRDDPATLSAIRLLTDDPQPAVRRVASVALMRLGDSDSALAMLARMAGDSQPATRQQAMLGAGECLPHSQAGRAQLLELIARGLNDPIPAVRRSAAAGMAEPPDELLEALVLCLGDEDRSVLQATAAALGRAGEGIRDTLLAALDAPSQAQGALLALGALPSPPDAGRLRQYARQCVSSATRYAAMASSLGADGDEPGRLLAESLQAKGRECALNALSAIALFKERSSVALSIESLNSPDGGQRANALEALESIGEPELIRPLIALWEPSSVSGGNEALDGWQEALRDPDAWIRACGVLYGLQATNGDLRQEITAMAHQDPDALVRETAARAAQGDDRMETLQTIPTMERILFLRRVTLFANLTPVDLKQVAGIARERLFTDGEVIVQKDEPGDEMYVIVSGEVSVRGESGGELARRLPGESVGEMAIISQQPRIATLVAQGDVRLLSIDQAQFEGILRERFEISLAVMRELCQRLKESTDQRNL